MEILELLQLAAMAAGIGIDRNRLDDPLWGDFLLLKTQHGQGVGWNPVVNDGDALRLAVHLKARIEFHDSGVSAYIDDAVQGYFEDITDDPCASTRLALVRAAAETGKKLRAGFTENRILQYGAHPAR